LIFHGILAFLLVIKRTVASVYFEFARNRNVHQHQDQAFLKPVAMLFCDSSTHPVILAWLDYTWITMNKFDFSFTATRTLLLPPLLLLAVGIAEAGDDKCAAVGEYGFVCGLNSAEDLVLVPGTKWIIASGMAPGAVMTLIDSQQKSWVEFYPADRPRAEQDMETYGACPGSPDPNNFVSHGLNIRAGKNGHSTLYVVGHGGREAIEVFDIDASGTKPLVTWTGCVMTPEGMAINSVASFSDGSLVATIPLRPGKTISEALGGELTGGVYQWSPGDSGFEVVRGTDLPYANGIEVSTDEQEFYIASSGGHEVIAYSRSNPARQLRTTKPLMFIPDNLHMDSDGRLVTAGLVINDPICGNLDGPEEFDLEKFASCPRPFIVRAIDPKTMEGTDLAKSAAIPQFSNITMGLQVGEDIWIGTFAGDRIAHRPLIPSN
jgi:sugar lactone lactonase YvrE